MRIYEVTFDGRSEDSDKWDPNWERVKVAVADGGALIAINLATSGLPKGTLKFRPAEVEVLAET